MTKKGKKVQSKLFTYEQPIVLFCIIAVIIVSSIFLVELIMVSRNYVKPVVDNRKTEMKKLPPEVKHQVEAASPSATFRVPILMYHYVEYVQDKRDTIRESLNIDPDIFEEQVKTLKNAGYTFMTAKELGDVLDGKMQMPKNPILLTFDDGHWDFYIDVLPILKKYNAKATAYIIPGFTGGSDFMTKDEVQAVVNSRLVDVGAHTVHHISLKGQLLSRVQYEVDESKTMLEQTYHVHVYSFAYPNGSFDAQAAQVVKDDGFTTSVSTVPGIEQSQTNRYFLYRLRPGRRTDQALLDWLKQDTFAEY